MTDLIKYIRETADMREAHMDGGIAIILRGAADRIEALERQNTDLQANNTKLVLEMRDMRQPVSGSALGELITLIKYCEWQIKWGADYHPTLPSAIASANQALAQAAAPKGENT
jgi:hypothetical protein